MLVGTNRIMLNLATVNLAIQEYLNKRIVGEGLVVTNTEQSSRNGGIEFEIYVKQPEPEKST